MAAFYLTFDTKSTTEALLLEEGAKDEKWPLVCDGRITSATSTPVGPVVYKGKPAVKDGPVTSALFMFSDLNDSAACVVEDQDPTDLDSTIAAFLDAYGANITAMRAKRPTNGIPG